MSSHDLSRRQFLKTAALGGAAITFAQFKPSSLWAGEMPTPAGALAPNWVDKPMRWAQLTLVEDDPGKFDLAFWLDYYKRTDCEGVCLSAGGCVAYYPTQIPFHHRSAWLDNRDWFGDLATGCRKLGMVVLARVDPHATYDDVQATHPDWIAVSADGKPRRHWASPEMWVTCGLGPYNFEFITSVNREIMSHYHVDGIFMNRWDGSGMCYCEHCAANFKAATGHELPHTDDRQDPVYHAYLNWRQQRLFDLWRLWDNEVRKINPDSCVIPNIGGGAFNTLDIKNYGAAAPMLVADYQARHGVMPPWANGKRVKEFRAVTGHKPVAGMFGVGLEEDYRWKDSVQSDAEIRIWALDGIANGARPWFGKFSGALHDRRWLGVVEDLYRWHRGAERYLRHPVEAGPLARVALVYSPQTAWFYTDRPGTKLEDFTLGWYQALVESRIPFEMVHDRLLDAASLARFKTLILPNTAALNDAQCDQLRAFVKNGGSLIATFETSLCDEWGVRRNDFGLGDLFGASWNGGVEGPMRNSYLRLEHGAGHDQPLLRGLEDAPRIINGVWRLEVEPHEPFTNTPLTLIPSYPDLPMEKAYPRQTRTNIAGVYLREVGPAVPSGPSPGRVVYFPWDIDRTFWEVSCVDHFKLLRNAVEWATNEKPVVEVTGPGFVEVTAWRNRDAVVIHLVNLTNPMAMKGPFRDFVPVGEQKVRVRLPNDARARKVHLLVARKNPHVQHNGAELTVTVPSLLDHEVVALDL